MILSLRLKNFNLHVKWLWGWGWRLSFYTKNHFTQKNNSESELMRNWVINWERMILKIKNFNSHFKWFRGWRWARAMSINWERINQILRHHPLSSTADIIIKLILSLIFISSSWWAPLTIWAATKKLGIV